MKYDVIIVGAGPSGYMCAYELANKNKDLKIILLDKGRNIYERRCPVLEHKIERCPVNQNGYQECFPACSITNGFGGAGAYSDGKFNITTEFGGWLTDYISPDQLMSLIDYVDRINLKYGATEVITNPDTEKVREIERRAMSVGVKLLRSKVRHLGTEENLKILSRIYDDLKKQIEMKFSTNVKDIIIKDNKVNGVVLENGEVIEGECVVLGVGREGSGWLNELFEKYKIPMSQTQVDIGVRVECPNLVMEEINNNLYEGKFLYKTSVGSTVRTFCSNPGGHVVMENYQGVINVNGHSYSDSKLSSDNTNFALLVSHHFEEPFKKPNEYALKVSSLANQLSCGSVIVQKYGDIKLGRRSTVKRIQEGFVRPTLKEAVPGDLALALPYKTMRSIIEMIEVLDKITPGIATEHTLLYGVEAKYYSAHPQMDNKLEVQGISNLYVAGDGAGLTRGLAQASACGIYIARNILEKGNKPMSKYVGTTSRGIRLPIIKKGDNLANIVVESVLVASKNEPFPIKDRDVIAITESVVARSQGNYATVDDIAKDVHAKFNGGEIGVIFPILSRNRFSILLKGFARGVKKIYLMLSYPSDEVGNALLTYDELDEKGVNPYSDVLSLEEYRKLFGHKVHEFTGVDYIDYYVGLIKKEGCDVEVIFANQAKAILKYTKKVLNCDIHTRNRTKKILKENGANIVLGMDEILNAPLNGSGYNEKYGLLGSNKSTEEIVKLFPRDAQPLIERIQNQILKKTGKHVEVMVYGDGAFKDPQGKIWELADPVVSPFFTEGLKGTPNELKLKYLADNDYKDLSGEELKEAIKNKIKEKSGSLVGKMASQGTTPRQLTDLIGSLCDLTSGSGDKGTPVVLVQDYFTNYSED